MDLNQISQIGILLQSPYLVNLNLILRSKVKVTKIQDQIYKWRYLKSKSMDFNQILQIGLLLQGLHLVKYLTLRSEVSVNVKVKYENGYIFRSNCSMG